MGIVSTIPEKCRRCYTCVRECPSKAIRVESGQAMVIEERCIACGNCVKVCAQSAKRIEDSTQEVRRLLSSNHPTFACLAPSFPAAFYPTRPGNVVAGVRALGFDQVWEVAFGAELISLKYAQLLGESKKSGIFWVTSPCPAIVSLVEKYMPSLRSSLIPIVSPMIAVARAIQHRYGADVKIIFVGPCIAKKNEIRDPGVKGAVDVVLTFTDLQKMFQQDGIDLSRLKESGFDSPRCHLSRSFPLSGGLLKTSGLSTDILENDVVITEGKERVLSALRELMEGHCSAKLLDVLFCEGCINGPQMNNDLSVFARKEIVVDFINTQNRHTTQRELTEALAEFEGVDLSRTFHGENMVLKDPSEEEIARALLQMKKFVLEDQLNCGACGYPTCREKAIAVCQGLAEAEMCLPYLVEELEETCSRLEDSNRDLAHTQERLVQTERLASMGQLSAGVAHEINNPLGTVLLYSHILLKELQDSGGVREDLLMIVKEANRCKQIVRGLLNFARQSRVFKSATDLRDVLQEVNSIALAQTRDREITLTTSVEDGVPIVFCDRSQIRQAFVNLVQNSLDSLGDKGRISVDISLCDQDPAVQIEVRDNGCGMSEEDQAKLFTPFFTTKEMGQGTGLGLAIVYGIVKMHNGDITVQSRLGEGTCFTITLPVRVESEHENESRNKEVSLLAGRSKEIS